MAFSVSIHPDVYLELDNAIAYYLVKSEDKVKRLLDMFDACILLLQKNPFFAIRYSNVRCLPLGKKLPYMLHFTIDEPNYTIYVHAIINTSKDSDTAWFIDKNNKG